MLVSLLDAAERKHLPLSTPLSLLTLNWLHSLFFSTERLLFVTSQAKSLFTLFVDLIDFVMSFLFFYQILWFALEIVISLTTGRSSPLLD